MAHTHPQQFVAQMVQQWHSSSFLSQIQRDSTPLSSFNFPPLCRSPSIDKARLPKSSREFNSSSFSLQRSIHHHRRRISFARNYFTRSQSPRSLYVSIVDRQCLTFHSPYSADSVSSSVSHQPTSTGKSPIVHGQPSS